MFLCEFMKMEGINMGHFQSSNPSLECAGTLYNKGGIRNAAFCMQNSNGIAERPIAKMCMYNVQMYLYQFIMPFDLKLLLLLQSS